MSRLGFDYTGVSNKKGTKRPTVDSFTKDHPHGTFIVKVARHVVAVVNGKYYDTWDSGDRLLYGYYTKREKWSADAAGAFTGGSKNYAFCK